MDPQGGFFLLQAMRGIRNSTIRLIPFHQFCWRCLQQAWRLEYIFIILVVWKMDEFSPQHDHDGCVCYQKRGVAGGFTQLLHVSMINFQFSRGFTSPMWFVVVHRQIHWCIICFPVALGGLRALFRPTKTQLGKQQNIPSLHLVGGLNPSEKN